MRRTILWVILGLFYVCIARGQNVPRDADKYRITQAVLNKVAVTFGDLRPSPKLTMPRGKSDKPARMTFQNEAQVILDEHVYNLCRKMGKDSLAALAFILGHELTHYFHGHMSPFNVESTASLTDDVRREKEADADLYGCIQAFAAGYNSFETAGAILERVYKDYSIPPSQEGYPTLGSRLDALKSSVRKARELAPLFEVGLFLYLKKEYAEAGHCFSDLTGKMPAAEFLNNLGLCQLQQVLNSGWVKAQHMPFRLPAEFDTSNRLLDQSRQVGNENEQGGLLESAIHNFERALQINSSYTSARINLICALLFKRRPATAQEMLEAEVLNSASTPNIMLLRGIAFALQGHYAKAKEELKRSEGAFSLDYNKRVLELMSQGVGAEELSTFAIKYQIESVSSASEPRTATENTLQDLGLPLSGKFPIVSSGQLPQPYLVRYQVAELNSIRAYKIVLAGSTYQVLQSSGTPGKQKTLGGVEQGDPVEKVKQVYGNPSRTVPIGNGAEFLCYDKAHLFVRVLNGRVDNWLVFYKDINPH